MLAGAPDSKPDPTVEDPSPSGNRIDRTGLGPRSAPGDASERKAASFERAVLADSGLAVVATDLSPAQVDRCREKGLEAHVRDMYDLGFPDESFDCDE